MKWVVRIVLALIALALVLAAGAMGFLAWHLNASAPRTEGEINLPGLSGQARIVRDEHGVAHIFGDGDDEVFFALGFAHASDRFFQMDLARRYIRGRLSEILGPDFVAVDARSRIRGYPGAAANVEATWSPEIARIVTAYTAGVNARLDDAPAPPEYLLLQVSPEPWEPVDSATLVIYLADMLASGFGEDMERARAAAALDPERLAEFLPGYPDWGPTTLKDEDIAPQAAPAGPPSPTTIRAEDAPGSNAWVVSGERSATGAPLLANDPHLSLGTPSIWYFARLDLSAGPVIGGTVPGTPFVLLGRNANGAWGYTNTGFKVIDLVERDPASIDIAERTETILVKGADPVELNVRRTPIGPVLDPDWFDVSAFDPDALVIERSTVTDPRNRSADAALEIMRSQDWDGFVEAARYWTAPMQNMHWAGVDGTIGYTTAGLLPIRGEDGEWTGYIPYDELPRVANPRGGMIASGNNRVVSDAYPYPVPGSYEVWRATRIETLIEDRATHDADSFTALQMDEASDFARRVLPALLAAEPETEDGRRALEMLRRWNGVLDASRPESLVFSSWLMALGPAVWADEMGESARYFRQPRRIFLDQVFTGEMGHWCDDVTTETVETCPQIAGRALDAAMAAEIERQGPDMADWAWGEARAARFSHPFASVPVIGERLSVRVPFGGDGSTVSVAHFSGYNGDYDAVHAASMRAIYDLSDLNETRWIHAPGQSGHPLSPHYRDLAARWARGGHVMIRDDWTWENPPQGSRTLALSPQP